MTNSFNIQEEKNKRKAIILFLKGEGKKDLYHLSVADPISIMEITTSSFC